MNGETSSTKLLLYQNVWNAVKLSWKYWNVVENAKFDNPYSYSRSQLFPMRTFNEQIYDCNKL